MGLKIGTARRKVRDTDAGSPFLSSLRVTGTMAHSHTGKTKARNPGEKEAEEAILSGEGAEFLIIDEHFDQTSGKTPQQYKARCFEEDRNDIDRDFLNIGLGSGDQA